MDYIEGHRLEVFCSVYLKTCLIRGMAFGGRDIIRGKVTVVISHSDQGHVILHKMNYDIHDLDVLTSYCY